jgi:(p)ppGpp synthase/HD superfamily hydrolase
MTTDQTQQLSGMRLAPYIELATILIGKSREAGGNMFRHQIDTLGILIDYGYIDSVLLKASVVHDIVEDISDFNHNNLLSIDVDSHAVYALVLEVTRSNGETKSDFLTRIRENGSHNAKILKVADRISNMISLGFVNNLDFVERYINETEQYIIPIASQVSHYMVIELEDLLKSRRRYLESYRSYITNNENIDPQEFI